MAPLVFRNLRYDPVKDFAPVAQVLTFRDALAVGPNHPARTVPEFIAWAKAHGKEAAFGTAGAGSVPHFFGVMIDQATGTQLVHVPYKGAAPMLADLMGGQIAAGVDSLTNLIELHRAGRIRIIATSAASVPHCRRRSRHSRSRASRPSTRSDGPPSTRARERRSR